MKFRADAKDVKTFIGFCILLLYLCAIGVLNVHSIAIDGSVYGFLPFEAFSGEYIGTTLMLFLIVMVGVFFSVSSYFFEREKGFGFSTQKKKGKNKKGGTNYTMEKSPFDDGKQSYMRRQAIVAPTSEYKKPRQGTMTPKDYERAKQYADNAKQKYINRKNNKKSSGCQTLKEY
jgi:hypothetical protein